jgi:hypothetical protein
MATMPVRRLGVALLAAAVVLTTGTAFATDLNLTATSHIGAGQQAITAPCTSVIATALVVYPFSYVYTIRLAGTGCTGTSLTVKVTLNNNGTNPETTVTGVAATAINTNGTGPLNVDVSGKNVQASALRAIAVLVTGS